MIGIYKITNPKGKIYIGQSVDIKERWNNYKRIHHNTIGPKIKNSLIKYGSHNHVLRTIEECTVEQLNEREIYWKQYYLDKFGWSKMLFCELYDKGGGPKSEETKQKISLANSGKKRSTEAKNKISQSKIGNQNLKGYKFTQEQKDKISQSKKGHPCYLDNQRSIKISQANKGINKGKKHSEETKQKRSKSKCKPVLQYDLNMNLIKEWDSLKETKGGYNLIKAIRENRIFRNSYWRYKIKQHGLA